MYIEIHTLYLTSNQNLETGTCLIYFHHRNRRRTSRPSIAGSTLNEKPSLVKHATSKGRFLSG